MDYIPNYFPDAQDIEWIKNMSFTDGSFDIKQTYDEIINSGIYDKSNVFLIREKTIKNNDI